MTWSAYRKTAPVEALLVEDLDEAEDLWGPGSRVDNLRAEWHPVNSELTGRLEVQTAEGWVVTELPVYLCRDPDEPDHAWPVDPEKFEAWYEPVDEEGST
jgi:hypothetical protein